MTITNGYCTLTEIKEQERLNITVTTYDTALEGIIEAVSRAIDSQCGRFFWTDTNDTTRYYTPKNAAYIDFNDYASVTTLSVDFDGSGTYVVWVENTNYYLAPYDANSDGMPYNFAEVITRGGTSFGVGIQKGVKVVGKRGFPAVPKPIKEACLLWSMRTYKRYATPLGVSAMTALGEMQVKVPPPDNDVLFMLSPYTILHFG